MFKWPSRGKLFAIAALVFTLSGIVNRSSSATDAKRWKWIGVWGFADCTYNCDVGEDERCNCFR